MEFEYDNLAKSSRLKVKISQANLFLEKVHTWLDVVTNTLLKILKGTPDNFL